jgi:Flp pilus assembly pilin Flp
MAQNYQVGFGRLPNQGMHMLSVLKRFVQDQTAQDLVEYELLVAFIVVVSAALFQLSQSGVASIWTVTNNNLQQGIQAAS